MQRMGCAGNKRYTCREAGGGTPLAKCAAQSMAANTSQNVRNPLLVQVVIPHIDNIECSFPEISTLVRSKLARCQHHDDQEADALVASLAGLITKVLEGLSADQLFKVSQSLIQALQKVATVERYTCIAHTGAICSLC